MNPTMLIRCVAATLAATTLLAQSAPAPAAREKRSADSTTEVKATDRMQVRLAEVIAMLEEDDLGPDERARAKKKLEEIVAKLREQRAMPPASAAAPAAPATPPAATAGPAAPSKRRAMLAPPDSGEMVKVESPKVTVFGPRGTVGTVVDVEGSKVEIAQDPQPAKAPKAPKAPKPPKAPAPPADEQDPAPPRKVLMETDAKGGQRRYVLDDTDGEVRMLKVDAEKARAGALKLREAVEESRADGEALREKVHGLTERAKDQATLERALVRSRKAAIEAERHGDAAADAKAYVRRAADAKRAHDEAMEAHGQALRVHEEARRVHEDARRVHAEAKRGHDEEAQRYKRAQAEAHADDERGHDRAREVYRRAPADASRAEEKARAFVLQRTRDDAERAEVRVRAGGDAKKADAGQARTRVLRVDDVTGDDDDDRKVEHLIQEMRSEMREIRKLVEQLRKQVSAAPRASSTNRFGAQGSPALLPHNRTVGGVPGTTTTYGWTTEAPQARKAAGQGNATTAPAPAAKKRASGTGASAGGQEPLRVEWRDGASGQGGSGSFEPLRMQWRSQGTSGFGGSGSFHPQGTGSTAETRYGAGGSSYSQMR